MLTLVNAGQHNTLNSAIKYAKGMLSSRPPAPDFIEFYERFGTAAREALVQLIENSYRGIRGVDLGDFSTAAKLVDMKRIYPLQDYFAGRDRLLLEKLGLYGRRV